MVKSGLQPRIRMELGQSMLKDWIPDYKRDFCDRAPRGFPGLAAAQVVSLGPCHYPALRLYTNSEIAVE